MLPASFDHSEQTTVYQSIDTNSSNTSSVHQASRLYLDIHLCALQLQAACWTSIARILPLIQPITWACVSCALSIEDKASLSRFSRIMKSISEFSWIMKSILLKFSACMLAVSSDQTPRWVWAKIYKSCEKHARSVREACEKYCEKHAESKKPLLDVATCTHFSSQLVLTFTWPWR